MFFVLNTVLQCVSEFYSLPSGLIIFNFLYEIYLESFCVRSEEPGISLICTNVSVKVPNWLTWSIKLFFLVFHALSLLLKIIENLVLCLFLVGCG